MPTQPVRVAGSMTRDSGGFAAPGKHCSRMRVRWQNITDEGFCFESLHPLFTQPLSVLALERSFNLGARFAERLDVGGAKFFDFHEVTAVVSLEDVADFARFERESDLG